MDSRGAPSKGRTRKGATGSDKPSLSPVFPLLLLETMRQRDRPEEVLEEEDISISMPRRLGLSEVVRMQIHRFEEEVKHRRPQSTAQVEDLVRLVIRRPDSEEIFQEAGWRVAQRYWLERAQWRQRMVRLLPRALALVVAQRAGKRMFAELVGPTPFKLARRPVSLRIESALTARSDPGGAACDFYSGALRGLLEFYTGARYRVIHTACGTRTGAHCEWTVELQGTGNREQGTGT